MFICIKGVFCRKHIFHLAISFNYLNMLIKGQRLIIEYYVKSTILLDVFYLVHLFSVSLFLYRPSLGLINRTYFMIPFCLQYYLYLKILVMALAFTSLINQSNLQIISCFMYNVKASQKYVSNSFVWLLSYILLIHML